MGLIWLIRYWVAYNDKETYLVLTHQWWFYMAVLLSYFVVLLPLLLIDVRFYQIFMLLMHYWLTLALFFGQWKPLKNIYSCWVINDPWDLQFAWTFANSSLLLNVFVHIFNLLLSFLLLSLTSLCGHYNLWLVLDVIAIFIFIFSSFPLSLAIFYRTVSYS